MKQIRPKRQHGRRRSMESRDKRLTESRDRRAKKQLWLKQLNPGITRGDQRSVHDCNNQVNNVFHCVDDFGDYTNDIK
jgi:hypothetical protein